MPTLKPEQLFAHLKNTMACIYWVSGDETLLIQEACDAIRQAARNSGYTERELYHCDANFDWNQLLAAGQSLSLFSEKKILELRLTKKPDEAARQALVSYAEHCNEDTLLLLVTPKIEKATKNAKWFKAIDQKAQVLQIWPVGVTQLPRWLSQRAKQLNLHIEHDAMEILVSRVEGNLLAAVQELEKLALLSEDGKVSPALMAHVVADSARYDVFSLIDKALHGDARGVAKTLQGLKGEGTELLAILWAVNREVRTLIQLQHAVSQGKNIATAARSFGIWDNRLPLIKSALHRLKPNYLQLVLRKTTRIDQAVKGISNEDPWQLCLDVLLNLAGTFSLSMTNEKLNNQA